jgi:lipid-binding SYLF domain-containing protein
MNKLFIIHVFLLGSLFSPCLAESAVALREKSEKTLLHLYETNSSAQALGGKAHAVLVFPDVYAAGFLAALQRGDGVLFKNGDSAGYYNTTSLSFGFQAGVQKFSYALFFMDQSSLDYLENSEGFELGAAPSFVVADIGFNRSISTTTLHEGIFAFFFNQSGLMGGINIQGTKITKYIPSR